MWISKQRYEHIMERIGDLERQQLNWATHDRLLETTSELRSEVSYLRSQLRILIDSLGLVHRHTSAKEEYVQKGGAKHG